MKRFALIGAAGYIAPRHLKAIHDVGGTLVAAYDPSDSVGHLDAYFPDAAFFTEFERFDRHLNKLQDRGESVEYISVCSPNYLHDSHIRYALRYGAHCICEKPLTLKPWNIDGLTGTSEQTGKQIFTILQLRLHDQVKALKEKVEAALAEDANAQFDVELTYITSRGQWYYASWKGDEEKSGGIAMNIGVHFFDMLMWIFGSAIEHRVHSRYHDRAAGVLTFKNARVRWFLSINSDTLPEPAKSEGQRTYRKLNIGPWDFDFSKGFTELHSLSYEKILSGEGFSERDTYAAIDLVNAMRNAPVMGPGVDAHPLAQLPQADHPFYKRK
jgi:UDP-N-acetyl-2-amino-2-deoxyglucuronate dehydrogenase